MTNFRTNELVSQAESWLVRQDCPSVNSADSVSDSV